MDDQRDVPRLTPDEPQRGAPAPVWEPTPERIERSNMTAFMRGLHDKWGVAVADYAQLYRFSIDHPARFWTFVWEFCGVIAQRRGDVVVQDITRMPGARWFPEARLNLAENLLRRRDDADALVALSETGAVTRLSFGALYAEVSRVEQALRGAGVRPGDRVAGYLPNVPQAVIAMLATATVGAVWCVCSTDLGADAVVDRLGQVDPKVLFIADSYEYDGRTFDLAGKGADVVRRLPSLETVVVVRTGNGEARLDGMANAQSWDRFLAAHEPAPIEFAQFAFDHPVFILFSSGTSGAPKCIVHGAGGALLQNLKDLSLQFDVKRDDRIFWWTGTGWVVWNLMLFGLGCEATVLLYDGSPFYPSVSTLFDYAARERVTFLRLTPKYVETVAKAGLEPGKSHDLSQLKCITVGGAPFGRAGYEYVYARVKADVQLASPAGGTDPLAALITGNPISPVWAGEMQCRGLGLKIEVFDEAGRPLVGEPGEVVCTMPFPSMPLGLWGDANGERFRATYFSAFPNVWRQGDWGEFTPRGGIVIHGRSDATLKVRGVRIGTAEIYRQVERIAEVADSVVVAREAGGDSEIVLFVQLAPGRHLDPALASRISTQIRHGASPRYVPDRIIQVDDIPRTATGKVSELAVRAALHGREVTNRQALVNPEALGLFEPARLGLAGATGGQIARD